MDRVSHSILNPWNSKRRICQTWMLLKVEAANCHLNEDTKLVGTAKVTSGLCDFQQFVHNKIMLTIARKINVKNKQAGNMIIIYLECKICVVRYWRGHLSGARCK